MDVHEHDFWRKPGGTLECACGASKRPLGGDPEPHVSQAAEARFLATAAKHPIDSDLLERARLYEGEPLPLGHLFIGVAGHPDDDECTYRADGTDETYCGQQEANHELHDCGSCQKCLHDGKKCCGCYDEACCQDPRSSEVGAENV